MNFVAAMAQYLRHVNFGGFSCIRGQVDAGNARLIKEKCYLFFFPPKVVFAWLIWRSPYLAFVLSYFSFICSNYLAESRVCFVVSLLVYLGTFHIHLCVSSSLLFIVLMYVYFSLT